MFLSDVLTLLFADLQNANSSLKRENNELTRELESLEKENKRFSDNIHVLKERLCSHEDETVGIKQQILQEKKSYQDLNEGLETNLNVS